MKCQVLFSQKNDIMKNKKFCSALKGVWGKESWSVCAFVCFARVGSCLFSLPVGVRDWLRLVIVALPGLFYLTLF